MTQQLDPYELVAPDQHILSADCPCGPTVIKVDDDWDLPTDGAACSIEDTDCEACQ